MKLSILQQSRHEKKLARRNVNVGTANFAGEATNNGELTARHGLARILEIPRLDFEQLIPNEQLAFRLDQLWSDIVEVDARERLIDM